MDSIRQFFSYMNDISFPYVVLRNWDELPYDVMLGEHSDLDLLVYDRAHFMEIFPQAELEHPLPRVRTKLPIGDSFIYLDVRFVGDDYYPEDFERAILATREFNQRGFWTPNALHHRIGLAYHAVHHKGGISPDYRRWLGDVSVEQLLEVLKASPIGWVEPSDRSVGKYNAYWKGATSVVEKKDGLIVKKQVSYNRFPLMRNEYDILARLSSSHFPRAHRLTEGLEMWIEDCGVPLTTENLPSDWQAQLEQILLELRQGGIQHRDIKQDNLMVKDGLIRLIDFGWAMPYNKRAGEFTELEDNPPSCLGMPNRPSTGFNDAYSMRCVKKQIEYQLEEKEASCAS